MKRLLQLAAAVLATGILFSAYQRNAAYLRNTLERRLYPPLRSNPAPALGAEIQREAAQKRFNEVSAEYRRVQRLVEEARAQGRDVTELEAKLAYAAQLAREGQFAQAKMFLNIAEVKIPRPPEPLRPAVSEDAADPFPDLEAGAAGPTPGGGRRRPARKAPR